MFSHLTRSSTQNLQKKKKTRKEREMLFNRWQMVFDLMDGLSQTFFSRNEQQQKKKNKKN